MSEVAVLTGIYGTEQTAMRGYDGRFIGARVNLDSLPPLPASVVAYALAEARGLT